MEPVIYVAFLVTLGAIITLMILIVAICIVKEIHDYEDLQRRLRREHNKKQANKQTPP